MFRVAHPPSLLLAPGPTASGGGVLTGAVARLSMIWSLVVQIAAGRPIPPGTAGFCVRTFPVSQAGTFPARHLPGQAPSPARPHQGSAGVPQVVPGPTSSKPPAGCRMSRCRGVPDIRGHEPEEVAVTERASEPSSTAATIDRLVRNAGRYAEPFRYAAAGARPALQVTVLTCMHARIDPARLLGLEPGDAHVLRNAGGVVTPDARRSLAISQRLLGTRAVAVIRHTGCGMLGLTEAFADGLAAVVGTRPEWQVHGFAD